MLTFWGALPHAESESFCTRSSESPFPVLSGVFLGVQLVGRVVIQLLKDPILRISGIDGELHLTTVPRAPGASSAAE